MIKNGYIIESNENEKLLKLQKARKLKLVELHKTTYACCKNCGLKYEYNNEIKEIECSCGKIFSPKPTILFTEIVNWQRIFNFLKLVSKNQYDSFSKEENCIEISDSNKKGKIVILDCCFNDYYFTPSSDDFVIRIMAFDSGQINKGLEEKKFLSLVDVINSPRILQESISLLFSNSGIVGEDDKLKMYNEFFENLTWQEFENFVNELLIFIQQHKSDVNKFILYLQKNQNIFGSKIVKFGGSGKPDIIQLPLADYLMPLLTSDQSFEVKKYGRASKLRLDDVGQAIRHANMYNKKGTIVITTTNQIEGGCWDCAIRNSDLIKVIIIDRFLLLRIIEGINANSLID